MTGTAHVHGMSFPAPVGARITTGHARLAGTFREPYLETHIHPKLRYPGDPKLSMVDWVKSLGSSYWDPSTQSWSIYGLGSLTPSTVLAQSGIELLWDERPEQFAGLQSIDELAWPIARLHSNGRIVMVRHRLAGFLYARELLGLGATWDKDRRLFLTHVGDVLHRGAIRGGVHWPQDAIDRAFDLHATVPVPHELAPIANYLANALGLDGLPEEQLARIGQLPQFQRPLFPYQEAGALAVAAGRTGLFDEPGLGKSFQALAAARILNTHRTLIVCPPLLTTNWAREAEMAGVVAAAADIAAFTPRRKEPALPDQGVVVISDSLLAARPETAERIKAWAADVMIVDEAHRHKTIGTARSEAVLNTAESVRHAPIALTGTPIFAAPHELVPLLELTRTLVPIFGGRSQFLEDFCRQDKFGGWHAKQASLPRLHATLKNHVWVRRRKRDALPQLPEKRRREMLIDVPLTGYRAAHKDVIAKVQAWVTWFSDHYHRLPSTEEREEYAMNSSFELISQLRRAAGLAKIDAAKELIVNHVEEAGFDVDENQSRIYRRPLIVWTHHIDVAAALFEAVPDDVGETVAIVGGTSDTARDDYVDRFQQGRIPVLIGAITKAGVGITLTRSSDSFFVETDWTPAVIKQAEDRTNRIGQSNASLYTTLIARGTLDEPIQRVLHAKTKVLEAALGDTDDGVAVMAEDDVSGLKDIALMVIDEAVNTWKKR